MSQRDAEPDAGLFGDLRVIARSMTSEDRVLDQPPALLWECIASEALESELVAAPVEPAPIADLATERARRRPRGTWILAIAAGLVAVVFLGVWALVGGKDEVIGSADLAALGEQGSGTAELLDHDGVLRLDMQLTDVEPGSDAYLEVWMIQSTEPLRLVSLGPVRSDGTYDLPDSMDPADFPIVDVSVEHFDGDSTHSGASVVRGELQF